MLRAATLIVVTLATAPALAGATDWQELASGARVRLISADALTDGATLAGIELQLPAFNEHLLAYPGGSGIPTDTRPVRPRPV